jgi:hypothetical protein
VLAEGLAGLPKPRLLRPPPSVRPQPLSLAVLAGLAQQGLQ